MLPFLKDRHEGGTSGPVENISLESDEDSDFGMMDAIVEDLLKAIEQKDKSLLKGALEALVQHIKDDDEVQDQESM